jgi:hypothetical protein
MSLTFGFSEANTSGESVTDSISNINFGSNDSPNIVVATYPIASVYPGSVQANSYSKYIKAKFGGTGWTQISNMKFWMSAGALVTGEKVVAKNNQAFGTPSQVDTGDSDVPITEGTALAINAAGGGSTIAFPGGYSAYIRLQLHANVGSASPSGSVNTKTFTFEYDVV